MRLSWSHLQPEISSKINCHWVTNVGQSSRTVLRASQASHFPVFQHDFALKSRACINSQGNFTTEKTLGPNFTRLKSPEQSPQWGNWWTNALHFFTSVSHSLTVHAFLLQTEIIRHHGYPAEEYTVQTEDGYLLYIQRIPAGRVEDSCDIHGCPPKEVVFLQHGLLCSASNWITNLPNESFAFLLADAGFDVWMGNVRGNTYGLRHIKYKTNSNKFWDFRY